MTFLLRLLVLYVVALAPPVLGQADIWVDELSPPKTLRSIAYIQSTDSLSVSDIRALDRASWQRVEGSANLGYDSAHYWFKFTVENKSRQRLARLVHLSYPLLDRIEFFHFENGVLMQQYLTGDKFEFFQRPIPHRDFVFPIALGPMQTGDVYIYIKTSGAVQLPIKIWDERTFHVESEKITFTKALFFGLLMVMAAFNLTLYFILRDRAYLPYSICTLTILLTSMSLHGSSFQYLYPFSPGVHEFVILFSVPTFLACLCIFTSQFLELAEKEQKVWYNISRLFCALAFLSAALSLFLPYSISTRISVFISLPICLFALVAGCYFWLKGEKNARLFTIAWVNLILGITATVLNKLGFLPNNIVSDNGILFGTAAQSVLFSIALAERFNREKEARMGAERLALNERLASEEKLLYKASHNELSDLPNRSVFENILSQLLAQKQQDFENGSKGVLVVLMHLCQFNHVNRTLGHENADTLICEIAKRLSVIATQMPHVIELEKIDGLARHVSHIEGVSFACAFDELSADDIEETLKLLLAEISGTIEFKGLTLDLQFVLGCTFTQDAKINGQKLLRETYTAFDHAIAERVDYALYNPEMSPYSPRRLTLVTELRSALENDLLTLHFQPQIHIKSGEIAGFEALIRWTHPIYGFIPPDEFIPLAEQTGLIKVLTRWVLEKAMVFCREMEALGCPAPVAINISAVNLNESDFSEHVISLRDSLGVHEDQLVLEVTETAAMANPKTALKALGILRDAQVRLSIDDFGTGHSSLSYIRQLPVHEIKIDRTFVMEMATKEADATIVQTMVNMCHDLGYSVVAEGVENAETLAMLETLNCEVAQGYHIARPMPAQDVKQWLAKVKEHAQAGEAKEGGVSHLNVNN